MEYSQSTGLGPTYLGIVIGGAVGYVLTALLLSPVDAGCKTLFVCYAEDPKEMASSDSCSNLPGTFLEPSLLRPCGCWTARRRASAPHSRRRWRRVRRSRRPGRTRTSRSPRRREAAGREDRGRIAACWMVGGRAGEAGARACEWGTSLVCVCVSE